MDRHAEDKLVKNTPEPHDPANFADQEEIEQSMDLWEEALSAALPEAEAVSETGNVEPVVRQTTESPLRAPLDEDLDIEPVRIESRDGFVQSPQEALRERLSEKTFDQIRVEVPVRLQNQKEDRPARRVFWFDRPVDAAGQSEGTLYALGEEGQLVPFGGGGGVRARRVVEVIEKESFEDQPPTNVELEAEVRSGIAHWSHA